MRSDMRIAVIAGQDLAARFGVVAAGGRLIMRQELESVMLKLKAAMECNIEHQFSHGRGFLDEIIIERTEMAGRIAPRASYGEIQEHGGRIHAVARRI